MGPSALLESDFAFRAMQAKRHSEEALENRWLRPGDDRSHMDGEGVGVPGGLSPSAKAEVVTKPQREK